MKKKAIVIITFLLCMFFCSNVFAGEYTDIAMSANYFKSYMSYKNFNSSSAQHALQQLCVTDADGLRKCNDRYVIAVGFGVGGQVGDCVDLILENGQIICCVIGDYKNNKHTDAVNLTGKNGCCSEFIVDTSVLRRDIKLGGNVECGYPVWDSPVKTIRRYNINLLGGK